MGTPNSATLDANEMREMSGKKQLSEFKFVVQSVFLVKEGLPSEEKTIGELQAEPVVVYGLSGLREFCDKFYSELARLNTNGEKS